MVAFPRKKCDFPEKSYSLSRVAHTKNFINLYELNVMLDYPIQNNTHYVIFLVQVKPRNIDLLHEQNQIKGSNESCSRRFRSKQIRHLILLRIK